MSFGANFFRRRVYPPLARLRLPQNIWVQLAAIPFHVVSNTEIKWDPSRLLFHLKSGSDELWVARRSRLRAYLPGVRPRLEKLEKEYGLDQVPFRNGAVALDIGANVGEVSRLFLEEGLRVYAFEPDPLEFQALQKSGGEMLTAFSIALWNQDGFADFFLANDSGDSSLIEGASGEHQTVKVETQTLDAWASAHLDSSESIQVLKLEAEGAEPEILEGAFKLLHRVEWLIADVGFERGPGRKSTLPEVVRHLLPRGFELVDIRRGRLVAIFKNTHLVTD